MTEIHPDRKSYEIIWDTLINEEIENYRSIYIRCIETIPNVKEEIWGKYVSLNNYCKANYMRSSDDKIDRHKVAACYMLAIATIRPMRFVMIDDEKVPIAINERLAITVGLSLIRAFFVSVVNEKKEITEEEKDKYLAKFKNGIKIPTENLVNHGDYLENFANEIHFAVSEGNANILSFAHELYLLEVITRISGDGQ